MISRINKSWKKSEKKTNLIRIIIIKGHRLRGEPKGDAFLRLLFVFYLEIRAPGAIVVVPSQLTSLSAALTVTDAPSVMLIYVTA